MYEIRLNIADEKLIHEKLVRIELETFSNRAVEKIFIRGWYLKMWILKYAKLKFYTGVKLDLLR